MSAAEYYNYRPTSPAAGGGGVGDEPSKTSASNYKNKYNNDSYSGGNGNSSTSPVASSAATGYNQSNQHETPYQSSLNLDDLSHPSSHNSPANTPHPNQANPFGDPHRDSAVSIPVKHGDLYADNIPLHDRPGGHSTTTYNPGIPPLISHATPSIQKRRTIPWFCYGMALVLTVVFIVELVRNQQLTGSPIATKPTFNPMIGPSPYVLINMGSRYVPCMQRQDVIANADVTIFFPCPNTTVGVASCTLSDLCGFNGTPSQEEMKNGAAPNQWFRFIIPMFLHAGFIHILFNMLLLLILGTYLEREIGLLRFALVYFSCGIFGFVLGGNFSPAGVPSVGASGALFGVIALNLLDLFYTWNERKLRGERPLRELMWLIAELIFAFVLGLFPGLDNFSHIGGFVMGILLGVALLRSPSLLRQRIGVDEPPYAPVHQGKVHGAEFGGGVINFAKNPVGFFKGRKPLWWAWWLVRAGALVAAIVMTVVLLNNFYVNRKECSWCKYLSCLPIKNWCEIGNLTIQNQN